MSTNWFLGLESKSRAGRKGKADQPHTAYHTLWILLGNSGRVLMACKHTPLFCNLWDSVQITLCSVPLGALDEIPKQVPLEAHGSFSVVLGDEDNLFLFPAHPSSPSRRGAALPPTAVISTTRGSCRLNCFLLLHLCTCQMRSDSNPALFSAVLLHINQSIYYTGHDGKYIHFAESSNGPVIQSPKQACKRNSWIRIVFQVIPLPFCFQAGSMNISMLGGGMWGPPGTLIFSSLLLLNCVNLYSSFIFSTVWLYSKKKHPKEFLINTTEL